MFFHRPQSWSVVLLLVVLTALLGCNAERPAKVPGESDIVVSGITLQSADGSDLTPKYGPLMDRLGMRKPSLILPGRYYSEFREAEDQRRIAAFWKNFGFFDVEVEKAKTVFDKAENTVEITWVIHENQRYRVADVQLQNAPEGYRDKLESMIPFEVGTTEIDLEGFRQGRIKMHDHLRRAGFGHATVYSRTFVDREEKVVHWFYYADAGPKTVIGKIVVEGNVKIPPELIKERAGYAPGDPYDLETKLQREFDLLDTGAFASSFIRTTAQTKFIVPGDAPDTGGVMKPEQIDEDGHYVPRKLPKELDLKIHVVEAPSQQFRIRGGAEFDPTRIDTSLNSRLWLRNLFGPLHHMVIEGRLGFGWLYRGSTDDPTGLYGEAMVRYLKPMWLSRLLDFRFTARFRDELFPGFHLREFTVGPGIRSTLAGGLFLDTDILFRLARQIDFGPFDEAIRSEYSLAKNDDYLGGEVQASLVWDKRDNAVEALRGHLVALRTTLSPGGTDNWNRYLTLGPEARGFLPVSASFSIAMKAGAAWVLLDDENQGVPLGPRLFGGGAWGMRGYGRHELSPFAAHCLTDSSGADLVCQGRPVGGLSLAEASIEGRLLPKLKPYGAVVFTDLGGAGTGANPFENGVSLAAGLGLRLRFWYLPAALDFAYRILKDSEVQEPDDDPFLVFFRIGEAF